MSLNCSGHNNQHHRLTQRHGFIKPQKQTFNRLSVIPSCSDSSAHSDDVLSDQNADDVTHAQTFAHKTPESTFFQKATRQEKRVLNEFNQELGDVLDSLLIYFDASPEKVLSEVETPLATQQNQPSVNLQICEEMLSFIDTAAKLSSTTKGNRFWHPLGGLQKDKFFSELQARIESDSGSEIRALIQRYEHRLYAFAGTCLFLLGTLLTVLCTSYSAVWAPWLFIPCVVLLVALLLMPVLSESQSRSLDILQKKFFDHLSDDSTTRSLLENIAQNYSDASSADEVPTPSEADEMALRKALHDAMLLTTVHIPKGWYTGLDLIEKLLDLKRLQTTQIKLHILQALALSLAPKPKQPSPSPEMADHFTQESELDT